MTLISNKGLRAVTKVVITVGMVMGLGAGALAQTSKTVVTPRSSSSSKNTSSIKVKESKYSASVSASAVRGFDEFAEPSAAYSGKVGMKLNKEWNSSLTLGYSHPFDMDAERTDRWELEDVSLGLGRKPFWESKSKKGDISLRVSLLLPTSGASKDSGLYSKVIVKVPYKYKTWKLTLQATPEFVAAYHQYETADRDGFAKNTPLGAALGLSISMQISTKWAISSSAKIYSLFDYDFNSKNIQIVTESISYQATKKISLSLVNSWRSRVITNNSLFDDDASSLSLTLGYSI